MRLSRWSRSAYETDADLAAEARALSGLVDVLPPGSDAEIVVVSSKLPLGERELARAPSARLVITTTSGTDHLDLDWMRRAGIAACRLPMARRDAVAEATLGMLIHGLRRVGELQERARRGAWARAELPELAPRTLAGSRVGVVGLGVIGRRMAAILDALGVEVLGADPAGLPPGVRPATVDEMLAECDAVCLLCDLNPTSRGILSRERIARARGGLVVVNTARGALLDVDAAVAALAAGRLGALAVDVFPEEPWPDLARVRELPGLLFTPHAAGYHARLPERIREGLVAAVGAFVRGEPLPHRRA